MTSITPFRHSSAGSFKIPTRNPPPAAPVSVQPERARGRETDRERERGRRRETDRERKRGGERDKQRGEERVNETHICE
jgi:hypothetical protein